MRILGIDPGSRVTGYGVVDSTGSKLVHVTDGQVKVRPSMTMPERLLAISEGLKEVYTEFRPDAVAVESVFFARNVKSALVLGQARGVALLSAAAHGLEVFEYAPTSVKQAVVGFGAATKDQVGHMVGSLLGMKGKGASGVDASDALAVAICHIHHSRPASTGAGNALRARPGA